MIYLWSGSDKQDGFTGKTEADDRKVWWNDELIGEPLPPLSEWEPPLLTLYLGDEKKRKPKPILDCSGPNVFNYINQKSADALSDILERHAELYPVTLEEKPDENFYMVVVRTELDALDRSRSKGQKSIINPDSELFVSVDEWAFHEDIIADNDLFYIPDVRTKSFVSERFKQRVADAGLRGFEFRTKFWDENSFVT